MKNNIKVIIEGMPASGKGVVTSIINKALLDAAKSGKLSRFDMVEVFGKGTESPTNIYKNTNRESQS